MPTYEYQCLECGKKVDYFQRISEPPVTECPTCKGKLTRLVSSGTGLIFKGSGFYITDYKKSNSSPTSSGNGNHVPTSESTKAEKPAESAPSESKPVAVDSNKQ